jgi:DNA repair protein RecO (recombination protein O)
MILILIYQFFWYAINMESFNQAIILNVHYTGANMALVTIFCEHLGLKKGIVKIAKKRQAELQKGNIIEYMHLKRKEQNLGTFKFNLIDQTFIKYFDNLNAMKNLNHICQNLTKHLKEDIPYNNLYNLTFNLLKDLGLQNNELVELYDYNLLKELGVSLDLKDYLKLDKEDKTPPYYISPKSGRVVSQKMGEPYKTKLLIIPQIIGGIEEQNQIELLHKINKFLYSQLYI